MREGVVERRSAGGDEDGRSEADHDQQHTDDPAHPHRGGQDREPARDHDQSQRGDERLRVGARDRDGVRGKSLGADRRLDPGAGRGEEGQATAGKQRQHDRGVQAPRGHNRLVRVEAGAVAGVTGRSVLVDHEEDGVAVAVEPHLTHLLDVSGRLALDPVVLAAAAPERAAAGGERAVQGLVVHPSDHQDVAAGGVLDNGGHEATGVALEARGHGRIEGAHAHHCLRRPEEGQPPTAGTGRPSSRTGASTRRRRRRARCGCRPRRVGRRRTRGRGRRSRRSRGGARW